MTGDAPPDPRVSVSRSIKKLRRERKLTQEELAARLPFSLTVYREVENNTKQHDNDDELLVEISRELGFEESYLGDILAGRAPEYTAPEIGAGRMLSSIRDALTGISEKLDAIQQQVANIDSRLTQPDVMQRISPPKVNLHPEQHHTTQDALARQDESAAEENR